MPITQPTQTFFFPNPFGDNQPVAIEATSLEEATAKLAALQAKPAKENPAPAQAPVVADQSAEKEA